MRRNGSLSLSRLLSSESLPSPRTALETSWSLIAPQSFSIPAMLLKTGSGKLGRFATPN